MYAEVVVNISADELNKSFTYAVPGELEESICPGARVSVPFGRGGRMVDGYVVSLSDKCAIDPGLIKEIGEILVGNETAEGRLVMLAAWISGYYSCGFIQALKTVLPLKKRINKRKKAEPETEPVISSPGDAVLTAEQAAVADSITEEWRGQDRPSLIFGVTGSGKTLIYMELIEKVIREGRQAILLIPEIALTYQNAGRFRERFGERVSILHSRLSAGEKYSEFKKARNGEVDIMIGPRSALFTPFSDLGLIIVDEEHEESYRSESAPRYHAAETAIKRGEIEKAHVVLGSATPSLDSYHKAENGIFKLIKLDKKFGSPAKINTSVVDMKRELRNGNRTIISDLLRERIEDNLSSGRQVMLFLNRRGYAGFVNCRSCGHVMKCPHCDVSLTQHKNGKLICHYCGYETAAVSKCPKCGSAVIGGIKTGTEQVEDIVRRLFPDAGVVRMDTDTTAGKEGHFKVLKKFASGEADILIGTQMIVKGHDYPNVGLVGVLMADLSLNDNDYRSAERTFQLISQAVGRTGRGGYEGEAVIQTYSPDHYAVIDAVSQDYEAFYRDEMVFREFLEYPPAGYLMGIFGSSENEKNLDKGMSYIRKYIESVDKDGIFTITGPAPLAVSKVNDVYRKAIYLRNAGHENLEIMAGKIDEYVRINPGFRNITVQYDHNV